MTFIIIIFIVIIAYLSIKYYLDKVEKEANEAFIEKIQLKYDLLKDIVLFSYDLKICPRCFEIKMGILKISETGQSVEYRCEHCNKNIISKLLPGKDGTEATIIFNDIKRLLAEFKNNVGDKFNDWEVDISILVENTIKSEVGKRQRTSIPENVRSEVWRRDLGKCSLCGSQLNLEFDHIIPFSKGGSNTARNIQLLCESCNRRKQAKI